MRHAQVCLGEIPLRLKMRKAHSADVMELETHQPNANAANRALELLGREVNLFTEKKEVGKPGDIDHISDEELMKFIEAQCEVVREQSFRQKALRSYRWYVMMGIGQVVTLRIPAERLREVNRALEETAWGGYRTEFYPTYDYKAVAEQQRRSSQ